MALLLAGALTLTPSCDTAVDNFAAVLEHREVGQLVRRLEAMIEACEVPPAPEETSPPKSRTVQAYRGMGGNVEQWRDLVAAYFPSSEVDRALCIISHESGGNPNAKNPRSSARGLFQILASLWAPHFGVSYDALYDPATNVKLAAQVWAQSGWAAWSPWNRGLCR